MTTNKALRWYNNLSLIHDLLSFIDWPYRDARKMTIDVLDLHAKDTVIDLFCGTGINFDPILAKIGKQGKIIGVFSNYEMVFANIFNAMPVGTRFAILEGYCKEGLRGAWLINLIGHSDCRRLPRTGRW